MNLQRVMKINVEKVMTLLRSKGLEGIAEPVLRFRANPVLEDEPDLGSSRMGGNPDLPVGLSWPTWHGRPLHFLLQLDLTELPRKLVGDLLPERGWIYFFYEIDVSPRGFDVSHRGSWRVLFFDGDRKALASQRRPDSFGGELKPRTLAFFEAIHLNWRSILDPKLKSDYYDLARQHLPDIVVEFFGNQIFGHTAGLQSSHEAMQHQCQLVSNGICLGPDWRVRVCDGFKAKQLESGNKDWRLLLELVSDEDAGLLWHDYGTLYFWIREDDLRNRDFRNVWAIF